MLTDVKPNKSNQRISGGGDVNNSQYRVLFSLHTCRSIEQNYDRGIVRSRLAMTSASRLISYAFHAAYNIPACGNYTVLHPLSVNTVDLLS